jgi:hypothetical protein
MSLPANVLSLEPHPDTYLFPINLPRDLLNDWTIGGVALNDTSQGNRVQAWQLTYSDPNFTLTPQDIGPPVVLPFTAAGCTEVALAFDANMDYVLAFVQAGQAKIRWFDITQSSHVVTDLEANARSPRCDLDDSRPLQIQIGTPDVIVGYFLGDKMVHRRQRDRYNDLYELASGLATETMHRCGMHHSNRFQFSYITTAEE